MKGYISNDKNLIRLPRQYLPQPHGRVCDEGLGKEGRAGITVLYRIRRYQPITCSNHTARQLTNQDYDEYDLLIGMDSANLRDMYRICGGDYAGKMSLLMDHTTRPGNVAYPWYTEDFEATWRDVLEGCQGLLRELLQE